MAIKKAFLPFMAIVTSGLAAGTVSQEVHDELEVLASAKVGAGGGKATTFHKDENGVVVAVKDYLQKLWMDPRVVEFGAKASSATGLNSMCKDSVGKWTKSKAEAKKAEAGLLTRLSTGELTIEQIPAAQAEIAAQSEIVEPREDGYGFETLDECLADSQARIEAGDLEV